MRSAWLVFLPFVAACSSFEEVKVSVPVPDGTQSMLLLYEPQFAVSPEITRVLYAVRADDPSPIPVVEEFVDDDRVTVTALSLRLDLEALRFSPGELPLVRRDDTKGRARGVPLKSVLTDDDVIDIQRFVAVAGGAPGQWTRVDGLPDDYLDLGCAQFEPEVAAVATCLPAGFALPLESDRVLMWSVDQRFFEITFDEAGMHPVPALSPSGLVRAPISQSNCAQERTDLDRLVRPDPRALLSALTDDSGRIWYGGVGRLYFTERYGQVPIELEIPPQPGAEPDLFGFIAGKTDLAAPDFEMFAMSLAGRIVRVHRVGSSTIAEEIFDYEPRQRLSENFGGLSYDGQGELVAAIANDDRVIRYRDGVVDDDRPLTGTGYAVARYIPSVGHVIAGDMGFILASDPAGELAGGWRKLRLLDNWSARIEGLAEFGDGLLLGGVNGFIAQYKPQTGFCPARQVASQTARWLIDVGVGHFTVGGHSINDSESPLNLLRPPAEQ